jgi:hypothetical protein
LNCGTPPTAAEAHGTATAAPRPRHGRVPRDGPPDEHAARTKAPAASNAATIIKDLDMMPPYVRLFTPSPQRMRLLPHLLGR